MRSPGFEPGFSALLAYPLFRRDDTKKVVQAWRADVLDQAIPSSSLREGEMTGRQPRTHVSNFLDFFLDISGF